MFDKKQMSEEDIKRQMLPEEEARVKIDKQLMNAGWEIVSRDEYNPQNPCAVEEALMTDRKESDYLLFIDGKAIAVIEAKKEANPLGEEVGKQAEGYANSPQSWYGTWIAGKIPLVYLANGKKIYFKNLITDPDGDYQELAAMHSPKKMLKLIKQKSAYGSLPRIEKKGLRDCQYRAEVEFENLLKEGKKKALAVLATGSGKTYLACLASYRLLNYTDVNRILFLVDRNNLARQTEREYSTFDRTEDGKKMTELYQVNRLKHNEDINGNIVISTIQKLFAVLTGQQLADSSEDAEDELNEKENDKTNQKAVTLDGDLTLAPDYFQLIIVDECHRSIYGKWKAVLDYFSGATILGLTATPTQEAYAYFNENVIEQYTYNDSIVDGVNVPARVYRIKTEAGEHGGAINAGEQFTEQAKKSNKATFVIAEARADYEARDLDRSVTNRNQIDTVLTAYRDAIYTDFYPEREEKWEYIPKTLIFAKDDNHATEIVNAVERVFAEKFTAGKVPEHFVQKITYSAGDSDTLIRNLNTEKDFRIAVTVTLVATGTDVKPLEVVLFMNDVKSDLLYTQMKGRGCRTISDDILKEVTPNADIKDCFYIVDAVGVTESDKIIPKPAKPGQKKLTLKDLLEHLAHRDVDDDNLKQLRDSLASIQNKYENNELYGALFGRHLDAFINKYSFAPRELANRINQALEKGALPPFVSPSESNAERMELIGCLIYDVAARKDLLQLQYGFRAEAPDNPDELISAEFSKETARDFIDSFEKYINENKDTIEALRIIYNSEDAVITHNMLADLQDKLRATNVQFTPYRLWSSYKLIDIDGSVEKLDSKYNINALTHLIQLVRYAYKRISTLASLYGNYSQRFNLYCGQVQRELTPMQKEVMKQIADYIIGEGAVTPLELNEFDHDLWSKGMVAFGKITAFQTEMQTLSKFILKVA